MIQENIPVGCVLSAAVAVKGRLPGVGCLPMGVSAQGVSTRGVSAQGVSAHGGVYPSMH